MKLAVRSLMTLGLAALLTVAPLDVLAQGQPGQPQPGQTPAEPAAPGQTPAEPGQTQPAEPQGEQSQQSAQPITGLELEGQIKSVGADDMIILLTGRDGAEMMFHYDDMTEVAGDVGSVQGLSAESGAWARVTYRAEGDQATAERIELIDAPADAAAPGAAADSPAGEAPQAEPAPAPGAGGQQQ